MQYQSRISGTRADIVIKVEAFGLHLENCLECLWVADLGYHVADWTRKYDVSHGVEIYELTLEPRGLPLDECQ